MAFLFRKNNNHFLSQEHKKVNTHVSVQIHKHKTKLSLSSITTFSVRNLKKFYNSEKASDKFNPKGVSICRTVFSQPSLFI